MRLASIIFQLAFSLSWLVMSHASSELANSKVLQTLYLSHATSSSSSFTDRGTITLTLDDNDHLQVNIENNNSIPSIEGDLKSLYKVRVSTHPRPDNHDDTTFVQTSVPLCSIMQANFRDEMELTLSPTGSILSISYKPLISPLAPSCEELVNIMGEDQKERSFQSRANIQIGKEGIAIPLLVQSKPVIGYKWLKQVRKEGSPAVGTDGEKRVDGPAFVDPTQTEEGTQNQSFLRKYWYIILPITLMSMMGGEDPQSSAASSSTSAAAAAASTGPGAVTAAMAGASSASSRQRRGKRS